MATAKSPPELQSAGSPSDGAPSYSVSNALVVESLMQIQKSLGLLIAQVETLKDSSGKQEQKLDRLSHAVYAASAVVAVLAALGGFLLNKVWDGVAQLLHTFPPPA